MPCILQVSWKTRETVWKKEVGWSAVGAKEDVEVIVAVHQQNRRQQDHVVAKSKHTQVCTQCLELA